MKPHPRPQELCIQRDVPPKSKVTFVCEVTWSFSRGFILLSSVYVLLIILDPQSGSMMFSETDASSCFFFWSIFWLNWLIFSTLVIQLGILRANLCVCVFHFRACCQYWTPLAQTRRHLELSYIWTHRSRLHEKAIIAALQTLFFQKISLQGATQYIQKANIHITSWGKTQQQFVQRTFLIQPPILSRFG